MTTYPTLFAKLAVREPYEQSLDRVKGLVQSLSRHPRGRSSRAPFFQGGGGPRDEMAEGPWFAGQVVTLTCQTFLVASWSHATQMDVVLLFSKGCS